MTFCSIQTGTAFTSIAICLTMVCAVVLPKQAHWFFAITTPSGAFEPMAFGNCRLSEMEPPIRFEAPTLIDAAGRGKWLGRPGTRCILDRQIAVIAVLEFDKPGCHDHRTWIEAVADGWWYRSPVYGKRIAAAYFSDPELLPCTPNDIADAWQPLIANAPHASARLKKAFFVRKPKVVAASTTMNSVVAQPGYVAAGDAAATIDPLSSHGLCYALTSGLNAADALLDPKPSHRLESYRKAIFSRFYDDVHTRRRFYGLEMRWPNSRFWQCRQRIEYDWIS